MAISSHLRSLTDRKTHIFSVPSSPACRAAPTACRRTGHPSAALLPARWRSNRTGGKVNGGRTTWTVAGTRISNPKTDQVLPNRAARQEGGAIPRAALSPGELLTCARHRCPRPHGCRHQATSYYLLTNSDPLPQAEIPISRWTPRVGSPRPRSNGCRPIRRASTALFCRIGRALDQASQASGSRAVRSQHRRLVARRRPLGQPHRTGFAVGIGLRRWDDITLGDGEGQEERVQCRR